MTWRGGTLLDGGMHPGPPATWQRVRRGERAKLQPLPSGVSGHSPMLHGVVPGGRRLADGRLLGLGSGSRSGPGTASAWKRRPRSVAGAGQFRPDVGIPEPDPFGHVLLGGSRNRTQGIRSGQGKPVPSSRLRTRPFRTGGVGWEPGPGSAAAPPRPGRRPRAKATPIGIQGQSIPGYRRNSFGIRHQS